jgi:hypothetical protein
MYRPIGICLAIAALAGPATAGTGVITGRVEKPATITAVSAINRDEPDKPYRGSIDTQTGVFTIKDLPLDCAYDVILDAGPTRLEGVNLKVPRSDYEEEQPLTREDVETLKKIALSLNKFENRVEVLAVAGNIQHAAVLMNKLRTEGFINSKPGEVIWRLEVQRFERPDDSWVKRQDELAVVHYRKRFQKTEFEKVALTLEPVLGGIEVTAKQPEVKLAPVAGPSPEPGVRLRQKK